MKFPLPCLLTCMAVILSTATAADAPSSTHYPTTRRGDLVEDHHGVTVADPYRWLEDLDSPETRAWVAAENRHTDSILAAFPGKAAIRASLAQLSGSETYGLPQRHGKHWFWSHNSGKQDQSPLYTAKSLDAAPTVLLDPNSISPDGSLALVRTVFSRDGSRVAYGLSIGGGDWQKWRIRDVATGQDLPDELEHIKYYAPAFTADGQGLYYSRFPAPPRGRELSETDHDCKVYFHRIGTPVAKDAIIYDRPERASWQFEPHVTGDGRFLVIAIGDGEVGDRRQEQIVYLDLAKPIVRPVQLVPAYEAEYIPLGNVGATLYFQTTLAAPKKRIVAIDTQSAERQWREIIPEGPNAIETARLVGGQIIITALADAHTAATAYDLSGKKLRDIALPGLGTAAGFNGAADDAETFFQFTSFTTPGSIYRYDLATGANTLWKAPNVRFDPSQLETTQVFYPSKDGTKVPMFLTCKKGLPRDGRNPTLLTAYGGFGNSLTPNFNPTMIAWMEHGGIFALANLRGGGEYGDAWHRAGTVAHKQVVFDDFIAAAEWLAANHYTSPDRLGVFGGSNGGLLIGAVITQRPELFGAAIPHAGVLDMLRFQLFGQGAGWQGEFGSPDKPDDFKALYAYSPVHNVQAGKKYPPTLVITADHDVRVAPLHSYKFAAALQAAQSGEAPILLRIETTSGHGGGTTRTRRIDQATEFLGFFSQSLKVEWK